MPACGMDTARSRAICGSNPMLANSVVPIAKAPRDSARMTSRRRPGDSGAVDEEREVEEECEVTKAPARGRGEERCRRGKRGGRIESIGGQWDEARAGEGSARGEKAGVPSACSWPSVARQAHRHGGRAR